MYADLFLQQCDKLFAVERDATGGTEIRAQVEEVVEDIDVKKCLLARIDTESKVIVGITCGVCLSILVCVHT